ncbi:MAG TPA: hypothetical protein VJ673_06560 [Aromatoleum sp.]|uniref:hypothetical protein n=1 Tax=Aromatoleum sp. TaxID=2307007 RepID=UPI002B4817A5|nr:hypothetical protein [Aromatoleum sp.]HJV25328.1 hypothetical protein [Aromatoleum sp.]
MGAPEFLDQLNAEGLVVVGDGDHLWVGPRDRLTDGLREQITCFKAQMLGLVAHRHWMVALPDRTILFTVPQGMTRAEVLQHYPTALDAQPRRGV